MVGGEVMTAQEVVRKTWRYPYQKKDAAKSINGEGTFGICGRCAQWTSEGDFFVSSQPQPGDGRVYYDNFICRRCQASH